MRPNHLAIPISAEFFYDSENRIISSSHLANSQTETMNYVYLNNDLLQSIKQHIIVNKDIADLEIIVMTEYSYDKNAEMFSRTIKVLVTNSDKDFEEGIPEIYQCVEFNTDSNCIKFVPRLMQEGTALIQKFIY